MRSRDVQRCGAAGRSALRAGTLSSAGAATATTGRCRDRVGDDGVGMVAGLGSPTFGWGRNLELKHRPTSLALP